jgi:hypothetical protein
MPQLGASLVLGHSRFLFARYVLHQDLQTLLRCHIQAFDAIGGVPIEILYDRMKTAVTGEDDNGYNAWQVDAAVAKVPLLRMEIVKRSGDMKGFVVMPRRWWSSAPSPGSAETGVSPRTSRTLPKPWPPSLPSPPSNWPSGGSPGRRS